MGGMELVGKRVTARVRASASGVTREHEASYKVRPRAHFL